MNTTIKYKDILIILLLICIGVMGYQIHELRNDSISRFVNCFKPLAARWHIWSAEVQWQRQPFRSFQGKGPNKSKILDCLFFPNNWVWMPELHPGTPKIGFLVNNYPYSEILGTLGPDLGPCTSILIFLNTRILIKGAMSNGGVHKLQIFGRET